VLLANIFFPGFGTMLSAATCLHLRNHVLLVQGKKTLCVGAIVCDGLLQLFLSPILIGWIWSVFFGYQVYITSKKALIIAQENTTIKTSQPNKQLI